MACAREESFLCDVSAEALVPRQMRLVNSSMGRGLYPRRLVCRDVSNEGQSGGTY